MINADVALKGRVGGKSSVDMFEMTKLGREAPQIAATGCTRRMTADLCSGPGSPYVGYTGRHGDHRTHRCRTHWQPTRAARSGTTLRRRDQQFTRAETLSVLVAELGPRARRQRWPRRRRLETSSWSRYR